MAAVASLSGQTNGLAPVSKELAEYEKILKIRDEIFAGAHPRLKVPEHVRRVSLLPKQAPVSTQPSQPVTTPTPVSDLKVPRLDLGKLADEISAATPPAVNGFSTNPTSSTPNKTPITGLDPIFLTKSDDLIRAEIQLQRQRLEKQLREQAENKRNEARTKAAIAEAKPDFDVTEVYEQALELVKPITLSEIKAANDAAANASPGDSFDENSFYSSRAPDSTPEDREERLRRNRGRRAQPETINLDDDEGETRVQSISVDIQQSARTGHKAPAFARRDSRTYPAAYHQPQDPSDRYSPPDAQITSYDDADDEPEYSPPEAAEPLLTYPSSAAQKSGHKRRPSGRAYEQYQRRDSPPPDMRIVRNTINSPFAPQPARLSFLAQTKGSPILQNRRHDAEPNGRRQYGGMESERTSPEMQTLPRKRRKLQEGRKGKNQRRGARSPGAAIKEEPVSPPPFHDVPPLLRSGAGSDRPITLDVDSPREVRYVPVERTQDYEQRPVAAYTVDSPAGQVSTTRSFSRPVYREVVRDNQDLRRVASFQNMQPGHQPEYVTQASYPEERLARAPSYAVLDRPARATSVMHEAPRVASSRQYIPQEPAPTSPIYREEYMMERPMSRTTVMAAPPPPSMQPERRIVVDQAGNRYYETIAAPREVSTMAPPQRQVLRDPYEPGPSQYIRASTVFEGPPRETRYVQEMPPPQFSNRASVAPQSRVFEEHGYAPVDQMSSQRDGSVQVVGYHPRQTSGYVDERPAPHGGYVRMSSVRPAEPYVQERVQRVSSARPMERAVSVFADDRGQAPREYLSVNQSNYAVNQHQAPVQHGTTYYQGSNGSQMSLDGGRDVRYSMVPQQRY